MIKKLKLNISTCPNDTFMFDAFINDKLENNKDKRFENNFDLQLLDIEEKEK